MLHCDPYPTRQVEGGVTVAAIESSRIRRTLLACTLGSTLPALCLAQTAPTDGMPPLPPLKGTAPLASRAVVVGEQTREPSTNYSEENHEMSREMRLKTTKILDSRMFRRATLTNHINSVAESTWH